MCARQTWLPLKLLGIVNLINSNSEQKKKEKRRRLIFAMLIEDEHLEEKWNRLSVCTVMYVVFCESFSFIITVQLQSYISIQTII